MGAIKLPTNYGFSLAKHMADKKLGSMKSHDYHILMQQLLPLCLRRLMAMEPHMGIMKLNCVFQQICVKVWNPIDIENLQKDVAITLSLLEKEFPPTFFDVMTHLLLHVVDELDIYGPIHNYWTYSVEQLMKVLKGYVHSMARLEGSMAKGYIL
jgi:hypothetical protein